MLGAEPTTVDPRRALTAARDAMAGAVAATLLVLAPAPRTAVSA
jgi:hypothetical protein